MAGPDFDGGGGGGRKAVDSQVNMIPMIDLLMVTISFLLITAVWTHMARIDADAQVPGHSSEDPPAPRADEKRLHVEMRAPDRFVLTWRQGSTVIESMEVPRREVRTTEAGGIDVTRFPELASRLETEWKAKGQHASVTDRAFDHAVLHTDDHAEFRDVVGVMDAIRETHRQVVVGTKVERVPAYSLVFAVN